MTTDGYLHQTARRHASEIRAIVESTAGRTVSDDEFWQFLKVIHVLSFDLNTLDSSNRGLGEDVTGIHHCRPG